MDPKTDQKQDQKSKPGTDLTAAQQQAQKAQEQAEKQAQEQDKKVQQKLKEDEEQGKKAIEKGEKLREKALENDPADYDPTKDKAEWIPGDDK